MGRVINTRILKFVCVSAIAGAVFITELMWGFWITAWFLDMKNLPSFNTFAFVDTFATALRSTALMVLVGVFISFGTTSNPSFQKLMLQAIGIVTAIVGILIAGLVLKFSGLLSVENVFFFIGIIIPILFVYVGWCIYTSRV